MESTRPLASRRLTLLRATRTSFVTFAALGLLGCEDKGKLSEQTAVDELQRLAPVVKEDVEQVRKGLPEGAAKLAAMLDVDTLGNPAGLQKAIARARASVKDLDIAKSTFFSFANTTGTVVRSEADPDVLAEKSITKPFPSLLKAIEPGSGNAEVFGEMPELRGLRTGQDLAWVVAHPVQDGDKVKGMFVTGWSFRLFARHLEETAKRHLIEATQKEKKKNVPIVYVFMVKAGKAYGTPLAPDVNAETIESLGVIEKTAAGPFRTNLEITGRGFGLAVQRTPELGADAALAVLLSEI
jgi:hypothetical protein